MQADARFNADPFRFGVEGRPGTGRMIMSDVGKTEIVFPLLEDIPPDYSITHEYSQARIAASWVDDFVSSRKAGVKCRPLPEMPVYQPKIQFKYATADIRSVYMTMCEKQKWVPSPIAVDSILEAMLTKDWVGDTFFFGLDNYVGFTSYVFECDPRLKACLKKDSVDPHPKLSDKRNGVCLMFNPLALASAPKVRQVEKEFFSFPLPDKSRRKIECLVGFYEMRGRLHKFYYPLDTSCYRVNYTVWSKHLNLWSTDLMCYDLVSYRDFWKAPKQEIVLKSWFPSFHLEVDPAVVERVPDYDIVNRLGRDCKGSGYVMCPGTYGIAANKVERAFVFKGTNIPVSLYRDKDGPIVMVRDKFSRSVVYLEWNQTDFQGLVRFSVAAGIGDVNDLVKIDLASDLSIGYAPRNFANFKLPYALRDYNGNGYLAFENIHGPTDLFESFYPTHTCAYNHELCYILGNSAMDSIATVSSLQKNDIFKNIMRSEFKDTYQACSAVVIGVDDDFVDE